MPSRRTFVRHVHKISKSDCQLRHVCLCIRAEQMGSYWMDFREINYWSIFKEYVEKIYSFIKIRQE
jgi:hypothetical protein